MNGDARSTPRVATAFAVAIAVIAAAAGATLVTLIARSGNRPTPPDFDQLWFSARAFLQHRDPYQLVGPGREFEWPFHMSYPAPAFLLIAPLAAFPVELARAIFVTLGVGAFAYLVARHRPEILPVLLAYPLLESTVLGQWSPLLAAALFIPAFQILFAGKPTIGAALWLGRPCWWPLGVGAALVAVSFVLLPTWASEWLTATTFTPYYVLALRPGGFVLLLALLRWRRPEARVLVGMALVPHTTISYEALYIMLAARTRIEAMLLVVLSYADPMADYLQLRAPLASYGARVARTGTLLVWALYVPTLVMILRRANEGTVPAWLERAANRLPTWLRGSTGVTPAVTTP